MKYSWYSCIFAIAITTIIGCATTVQYSMGGTSDSPSTAGTTEAELLVQTGNNGCIRYLKYSNDGKYIMSATHNDAKIYERETGVLVKEFHVPTFKDFSPDARYLSYMEMKNDKSRIVLQDILTKKKTILGYESDTFVHQYSFSPDGKYLIVPNSNSIDLYDVATHEKKQILANSGFYFYNQIAWSADCRYLSILANTSKGKAPYTHFIYDMKKKKIIKKFYNRNKKALLLTAISPDGKYAACIDSVGTVCVGSTDPDITDYSYFSLPADCGETCGLVFSPDGKNIYALKERMRKRMDMDTQDIYAMEFNEDVTSIAFHPGNSNEDALGTYMRIEVYDGSKLTKKISGCSHITMIRYNAKQDILFATDSGGTEASFFDKDLSRLQISNAIPQGVVAGRLAFTDKGLYYSDYKNKAVFLRNLGKNTDTEILRNVSAQNLVASPDGLYIVFYDDSQNITMLYNTMTKQLARIPNGNTKFLTTSTCFSKQNRFLGISFEKNCVIYDIPKQQVVYSIDIKNTSNISFSPDERYFTYTDSGILTVFDTNTWHALHTVQHAYTPAFSADSKYFAFFTSILSENNVNNINLYSIRNWELISKIPAPYTDYHMQFNNDGTKIMTAGNTGIIHCYSVKNKELISRTIANENGDWLTYTPEGYFNGSPDGINNFVHLVNGMEVTGLDQVAETLFRPDLVAAKLRGEDISAKENAVSLTELVSSGDAPLVQFVNPPASSSKRDITVNFSVQDAGGGVGAVYLKINGKVIQLADGSRKLELVGGNANTTQKSSGKTTNFSHLLTLQNGENTLEAYATNAAGKIESRHAVAKISWQGSTAKPNLYVLAVGVNKYRDKSLWLNYAVPDATSIADSFRSVKGNLYQSVNVTTVFDGDVTADGISSAFNSLAGKVGADDVFIFYLSGHGTTHTDGDYYFIPVDFRFRNAQSVPETAVSKHFITEQLSKIKAQKTLVMLDTCNSGAFISTGARGMAEKTAIDRLSRATGQATIAASSDTQSAMEGYEGHGIFTFVILEGLSGKADTNKDGYVSLSELSAYAEEKVPDYCYAKWGYEQYPQVDLRKQSNFPLVGK